MLDPFKNLDIKENTITAKHNCLISIDKKEFGEENITDTAEKLILPGIFEIYVPEKEDFIPLIYNYDIGILKTENIIEEKDVVTIHYKKNEKIVDQEYHEIKDKLDNIIKLLEGRAEYIKDPTTLLKMLHDIFDDVDIVHYETIISNMLREADDTQQRCRLKGTYKDCVVLGQTKQASEDSLLSSLAYQNIDRAISKGLVNERSSEMNSLEKIINEDFS